MCRANMRERLEKMRDVHSRYVFNKYNCSGVRKKYLVSRCSQQYPLTK